MLACLANSPCSPCVTFEFKAGGEFLLSWKFKLIASQVSPLTRVISPTGFLSQAHLCKRWSHCGVVWHAVFGAGVGLGFTRQISDRCFHRMSVGKCACLYRLIFLTWSLCGKVCCFVRTELCWYLQMTSEAKEEKVEAAVQTKDDKKTQGTLHPNYKGMVEVALTMVSYPRNFSMFVFSTAMS